MKQVFEGVYLEEKKLFTKYKEENRFWDAYHSKLAAAIKKKTKNWGFKKNSKILYLGAAEGTTISHLSDITPNGAIIGVDISPEPFKKFLKLCEERDNVIPVLSDANHPENYSDLMKEIGRVDIIYQDLAQKIQADILIKNAELFLKKNGFAYYMVKALSIDVTQKPSKTFKQEEDKLKKAGFEILEKKSLEPYQKGHAVIIARYKIAEPDLKPGYKKELDKISRGKHFSRKEFEKRVYKTKRKK